MEDKTFNQVELKPEMTSRHFTLYQTTTVLLLQGLASYVVYITTAYSYGHKYRVLQRQSQHIYT